jgi:hypothetical protein
VVLITDLVTPANVNAPILYVLPVLMLAWEGSRFLLWMQVPIILAANFIGFFLGPQPETAELNSRLLINRLVAAGAVVLVALVMHILISRRIPTTPWRPEK